MISLRVNGTSYSFNTDNNDDEDMPLLWFLRENAKLTGTKYGCGIGECGACTVHVNGEAARSCSIPMSTVDGADIITIEHLSKDNELHTIQKIWIDEDVPQCGYCQTGQIMATIDFLKRFPNPTDQDINENHTNICRCGSYESIRRAIHKTAKVMRNGDAS